MTKLNVRHFGVQAYLDSYTAMRKFTEVRTESSNDEIWLLQHAPVFTQGLAGKPEHILDAGDVPIIQSDRGGQVTYHGPGQLIVYLLLDLQRLKLTVKPYVSALESALINMLAQLNISAHRIDKAPGVYVDDAKIAALGIRIKQQRSYHGLALNINLDLEPFTGINPCGYQDLKVTSLAKLKCEISLLNAANMLLNTLIKALSLESYTVIHHHHADNITNLQL